jgi:outer membrane cobalamin receptor
MRLSPTPFLLALLATTAGAFPAAAADAPEAAPPDTSAIVANLSLDELNALRVRIASIADKPVREQPGIVTVITEQDIAALGARDLMDILASVPGFAFGTDVDATVGADFRGLWAYEGKLLVLLDGIAVNDGLYGSVQIGHHYAASQIHQVEIIRGPGSARYGGNAELAVISITSRGAEQQGASVSWRPEIVSDRTGSSLSGHAGYTFARDWRVSLGAEYEDFVRSDQTYVSTGGQRVDMKQRSRMTPSMINGTVGWKGLEVHGVYDNYRFDNPTGFGNPALQTAPWSETFRSLMTSASFDYEVTPALTVSPKVTFVRQHPWWLQTSPGQGDFELRYDKLSLDVPAVVTFDARNHLLVGVTAYSERATALQTSAFFGQPVPARFFNGSDHVRYDDESVYAQYDLDTPWANVSGGARYEKHDYAGSAIVPRVGVTRVWDRFHLKLLYDEAFRTPNVETIQQRLGSASVTYEKSTNYQAEAGYQFSDHLSAVTNLFHARVQKPLAFTVVSTTQFGYINGGAISTHGGELEVRYVRQKFSGSAGYSNYRADRQLGEAIGLYGSSVRGLNLALPAHRFSFSGTYRLREALTWNVNGTAISRRRAFRDPGAEAWLAAEWNVNTYAEYRTRLLSFGLGAWNVLDQPLELGQPYNGGGAPLPLLRRNFSITLTRQF